MSICADTGFGSNRLIYALRCRVNAERQYALRRFVRQRISLQAQPHLVLRPHPLTSDQHFILNCI
jgi:hypothetical protein